MIRDLRDLIAMGAFDLLSVPHKLRMYRVFMREAPINLVIIRIAHRKQ